MVDNSGDDDNDNNNPEPVQLGSTSPPTFSIRSPDPLSQIPGSQPLSRKMFQAQIAYLVN
ncbi:hypothetical protein BDV34DRAFT_231697 [Aspergillus parasiticus]|uniref:Uncharacterized protein n=1 Tax=Aspergillus parasiticus TaxID=5067 RepID=A0A5N6D153_ASPPA|nr:hypothetical protein BDV34DRAFT_231697 [Aspergillus parasiticus]